MQICNENYLCNREIASQLKTVRGPICRCSLRSSLEFNVIAPVVITNSIAETNVQCNKTVYC